MASSSSHDAVEVASVDSSAASPPTAGGSSTSPASAADAHTTLKSATVSTSSLPSSPPLPQIATTDFATAKTSPKPGRTQSLSPSSAGSSNMTASSTPLGGINAARRPGPPPPSLSTRSSGLNVSQDLQARMKAFHLNRQGTPPIARPTMPTPQLGRTPGAPITPTSPAPPSAASGALRGGVPPGITIPGRPGVGNFTNSSPALVNVGMAGKKLSLAEKRGQKMTGNLPGGVVPGGGLPTPGAGAARRKPGLTLSQMNGGPAAVNQETQSAPAKQETMMEKYAEFVDVKTGSLRFKGKATLSATGVEFSSGTTFNISLDEVDTLDELGKGNYGTVYKVRHSRPRMRRPGLGLAGNKAPSRAQQPSCSSPARVGTERAGESSPTSAKPTGDTTGVVMAMKEIRLELDDAKFAAIIMELDILHRCVSPYIIDFYGAFFQEGAVYICMEFMDGGSIDKLYGDGIPENVLRKITLATTMGLKSLKEDHNIIHRDVKPTNILMNTRGQVKICDFGVSGNLVASIAKTNIGCQSYMAPERISSGGIVQAGANPGGGTYSVQSDIWSLGLTIIECALGRYPYPPETYNNIFSQLSAIVDGEPPDLPEKGYSDAARNFVHGCLNKIPKLRPTYAMLLQHVWLTSLQEDKTILEEDEDEDAQAPAPPLKSTASDPPRLETAADDSATLASPTSSTTAAAFTAPTDVVDKEVSEWVIDAIERRRAGRMGKSAKPALHAAPLDAVSSPNET